MYRREQAGQDLMRLLDLQPKQVYGLPESPRVDVAEPSTNGQNR